MARRSLEQRLEEVARLCAEAEAVALRDGIRLALSDRHPMVVARAARCAGRRELSELESDLAAALDRLLDGGGTPDTGCTAKTALAETLCRLEAGAQDVFLRGIRHVQHEPVYGGRVDTAAELRAWCALGLAATGHPRVMSELADLLADPEPAARAGAARALAASGEPGAASLLRFKARIGDPRPEVVGDTLAALLAVEGADAVPLVEERLLGADEAVSEAAALALGESRLEAGLEALRRAADAALKTGRRRTLLQAIALLRLDAAVDYLADLVCEGPAGVACDAIAALAVYRHDDGLRRRLEGLLARRKDRMVRQAFEERFG